MHCRALGRSGNLGGAGGISIRNIFEGTGSVSDSAKIWRPLAFVRFRRPYAVMFIPMIAYPFWWDFARFCICSSPKGLYCAFFSPVLLLRAAGRMGTWGHITTNFWDTLYKLTIIQGKRVCIPHRIVPITNFDTLAPLLLIWYENNMRNDGGFVWKMNFPFLWLGGQFVACSWYVQPTLKKA